MSKRRNSVKPTSVDSDEKRNTGPTIPKKGKFEWEPSVRDETYPCEKVLYKSLLVLPPMWRENACKFHTANIEEFDGKPMRVGSFAEQAYIAVNSRFAYETLLKNPHPNIVNILAICDVIFGPVLMERLGSSLLITRNISMDPVYIPFRTIFKIIHALGQGVRHLQGLNILHNDIAPRNICFDREMSFSMNAPNWLGCNNDWTVKIIDFDRATPYSSDPRRRPVEMTFDMSECADDVRDFLYPTSLNYFGEYSTDPEEVALKNATNEILDMAYHSKNYPAIFDAFEVVKDNFNI